MTAPHEGSPELRAESRRVRDELRAHVDQLASVVEELRQVARLDEPAQIDPVQQEAAQARTTGAADRE